MNQAHQRLFPSFFLGGFECSTHLRRGGGRHDLIASTRHDTLASRDYARLRGAGIATARDGIRWHLVEPSPGQYRWESVLPMLRAARETGVQVIWDLCHFGWPEGLDVFSPAFVDRFRGFARAFARLLREEGEQGPFVCPVNEISFLSWGGGDVACINPGCRGRGVELKANLVRACVAGSAAILDVLPAARLVHCDPGIHIEPHPDRPWQRGEAEFYTEVMFEAWDMIAGRRAPDLGGRPEFLDILGVNYYWNNQWFHCGRPIRRDEPQYRPLATILGDIHARYGRPLLISETGIEDAARAEWFDFICDEASAALRAGVPLQGVCLYPVVNHPGWDDDRHCHNGLWDYADEHGERSAHEPLARVLARRRPALERLWRECLPTVESLRGETTHA